MRQRHLALLLNAAARLAALTTAQPVSAPPPQHTAIYTTTLAAADDERPQAITTVVVTLLMPREQPHYPTDGAPVTGTAISRFSTGISTWSATTELYWTLSGNIPLGVDSTNPPPPLGATTTLTSTFTSTDYFATDLYGVWFTHLHYDFYTTSRVTLVEAVGTAYPATIIRTGYTLIEAEATGGNVADTVTYTDKATATVWRTTTMVQVKGRPTPWE